MKNHSEEIHNNLTILNFNYRNKNHYYWNCQCICSNIKSIEYYKLISNHTKSCGCMKNKTIAKARIKHGYTIEGKILSEYSSWSNMIARCTNINCKCYNVYGGKGITVCKKWLTFEGFIKDMGNKPNKEYSIDRINGTKGYYKENCRWATKLEQGNNLISNKKVLNIITNEEYTSISEAAKIFNINRTTLTNQLKGKNKNKTNLKLIE